MHYSMLAYLDPGSGSIILQILIASLLAIGLAVRGSWARIRRFFGGKRRTEDDDEADDTQP
jgi:hypothetical protein